VAQARAQQSRERCDVSASFVMAFDPASYFLGMYHANLQAKRAVAALRLHRGGVLYRECIWKIDSINSRRSALTQLDAASWLAMVCIFVGWFLTDTLVLSMGPPAHSLHSTTWRRFGKSIQLFNGIDHAIRMYLAFDCLCLMLSLRRWRRSSGAPVPPAHDMIPFALMVICAALIAARSPGDYSMLRSDTSSHDLIVRQRCEGSRRDGGDERITVGAGAYSR